MKKIFIVSIICLAISGSLSAQSQTSIAYSVGFSTGDLKDYISNASFRGVSIDYRKLVQPNFGVGVSVGWNVFFDRLDSDTYTIDNISLTGKQFRYSNSLPMLISGTYYLRPGDRINPFVGVGTGVIYTKRRTDMNLYSLNQEAWGFGLQPEIGFVFTNSEAAAFTVSVKYNEGFKAGNELKNAQSYISLNVGLVLIK